MYSVVMSDSAGDVSDDVNDDVNTGSDTPTDGAPGNLDHDKAWNTLYKIASVFKPVRYNIVFRDLISLHSIF